MLNSLDPDQARYFVGPDLGTNCLQRYQQTTLLVVGKELTLCLLFMVDGLEYTQYVN